ncbi:ribonuclease Z [Thiobacter aerophilum]|uniref:MBL fold metallo-hydrolase n=1 Tax=Thiobacter aerophilum TaxID=3121275 RepID=A0ABV0EF51_9BURK
MRPLFHPQLVNDPFGDPALYVDCLFEGRALLFDLGDLRALPPRKLLRISHVFVSHAHMDHFMGFDWLLRVCLGRDRAMHLFGPPGFLDQVEHKLAAYTWNLVHNYETDFTLHVTEIEPGRGARRACFRCRNAFRREEEASFPATDVLVAKPLFRVRSTLLDHRTPCLAFALEEQAHVNVWKNRLKETGLAPGPWLRLAKQAMLEAKPDDTPIEALTQEGKKRMVTLGMLRGDVVHRGPGQKIVYVTDAVYHEENARRIIALAQGADLLFIETPFLDELAERARKRCHLTAWQAGTLARAAGVNQVVSFHYSPIYRGQEARLREELAAAFRGETTLAATAKSGGLLPPLP